MPPEPLETFRLGDACPICGHMTDTGAHALEQPPGSDRLLVICPSYEEFILDGSKITLFGDRPAPPSPQRPLE